MKFIYYLLILKCPRILNNSNISGIVSKPRSGVTFRWNAAEMTHNKRVNGVMVQTVTIIFYKFRILTNFNTSNKTRKKLRNMVSVP